MNTPRTWFRTANGPTRRAATLTAVLVAGLVITLTQVPLPLQARAFAVTGQSVVAHPDGGRVLVQQQHAIAIVDATTGEVTATVPLGSLVPGPGIAIAPGTSRAVVLATPDQQDVVTVTVDVGRAAVTSVTTEAHLSAGDIVSMRSLGVDHTGSAVVSDRTETFAVGADGRVWRSTYSGIEGVPGSGPYLYDYMSISPGGRWLYAAGLTRALVVDTATGRIEQDVPAVYRSDVRSGDGAVPKDWTVLLAADGEHVFISEPSASRITVRALDGEVVSTVEVDAPTGTNGIALSPDGATLYAALADRLLAVDVGAYV